MVLQLGVRADEGFLEDEEVDGLVLEQLRSAAETEIDEVDGVVVGGAFLMQHDVGGRQVAVQQLASVQLADDFAGQPQEEVDCLTRDYAVRAWCSGAR